MGEILLPNPLVNGMTGRITGQVFAELVDTHPVTGMAAGSEGSDVVAEGVETLQETREKHWPSCLCADSE